MMYADEDGDKCSAKPTLGWEDGHYKAYWTYSNINSKKSESENVWWDMVLPSG